MPIDDAPRPLIRSRIMAKLEWELIQETYSTPSSRPDGFTYRAKVPGGWLVSVWAGSDQKHGWGGGLTFYPEPAHAWDAEPRELSKKVSSVHSPTTMTADFETSVER
jgi:hypothetical protein